MSTAPICKKSTIASTLAPACTPSPAGGTRRPPPNPERQPADAAELASLDAAFLRSDGPLDLDLGCARGHFLVSAARQNPGIRFLGVDFQISRVRETRRKLQRLSLDNARAVRGEILETIVRLLPAGSVRRIHLLFSDPWPKRRHANRRLLQPPALDIFFHLLEADGELRFLTDDETYFRQGEVLLHATPGWKILAADPFAGWPETEFQARFRRLGKPVRGLCAAKCPLS